MGVSALIERELGACYVYGVSTGLYKRLPSFGIHVLNIMTSYNTTRYMNELLEKHASDPPSFTVHLYPEHWTLNGGSRFLYNNQVAVSPTSH